MSAQTPGHWYATPSLIGLTALILLCLVLVLFWIREHQGVARRALVSSVHALAEDLLSSSSAIELLRKLEETLPGPLNLAAVRVFLANAKTGRLTSVPSAGDPAPQPVDLDSPAPGLPAELARVFKDRVVVEATGSGAVLLVPMLAHGCNRGVLCLEHTKRAGRFSPDEKEALQHLANQAAASLEIEEQQRTHEQIFRTEKLAATGQLISTVAAELRAPIDAILDAAAGDTTGLPALRIIREEAERASAMVSRLLTFGPTGPSETQPIELSSLLAGLLRFREREWKALSVESGLRLPGRAIYTEGFQGQLEQLFLSILAYAERNAAESTARRIDIDARATGERATVDISHSSQAGTPPAALSEWRRVVEAHGGELRFVRTPEGCREEIELTLSAAIPAAPPTQLERRRTRVLTTLAIEPDAAFRRRLVFDLTARLHRVVPVSSGEEAIELASRFAFDAAFCATRLPGAGWEECRKRIAGSVRVFVVMAEGFEAEVEGPAQRATCFVLHKPAYEVDLENVLNRVDPLFEPASPAPARA